MSRAKWNCVPVDDILTKVGRSYMYVGPLRKFFDKPIISNDKNFEIELKNLIYKYFDFFLCF